MSNSGIPLDKAELLSTLLEGILYGFSLLMFGETIRQLLSRRRTRNVNYKMVVVACLLMLNSTVHLVIDIIRVMDGLILVRDTYKGGPPMFFASVSHWTFVSKNYVYAIQTLIGDGVIIYRCYAVWQSKLVIILPVCLWCAVAVTGFQSAYAASQLTAQQNVFCEQLAVWIKTFYAAAFVTNVLTTCLLAFRIWYLDQQATQLRGHSKSQLGEILRTIVDAGAIYSLTLLALMLCYTVHTNGQFVILNMMMPIISITFYMVIIRVGAFCNRASQERDGVQQSQGSTVSYRTGAENRVQICATTLSKDVKVEDGQVLSIEQMFAGGDGESDRYHSDTNIDGSGDAV